MNKGVTLGTKMMIVIYRPMVFRYDDLSPLLQHYPAAVNETRERDRLGDMSSYLEKQFH